MHIPKDKEDKTMTSMTNRYFEELYRLGCEYQKAKEAREEEKREIIDTKGWDSEEYKAWREREEGIRFPLNGGQQRAFQAWRYTKENDLETFTMNDFIWDKDVADFAEALRQAGISEFLYTNQSTAVMDNIHDLEANGFRMAGLATFEKAGWWKDEKETVRALRFEAK